VIVIKFLKCFYGNMSGFIALAVTLANSHISAFQHLIEVFRPLVVCTQDSEGSTLAVLVATVKFLVPKRWDCLIVAVRSSHLGDFGTNGYSPDEERADSVNLEFLRAVR
jgi:hypothetical protein